MISTKIDNPELTATVSSNVSPTTPSTMQIPPLFSDDVFVNEHHLSLVNSRRSSLQVLNISSSSIPRVIGRGGSNVNTIREVTGAHVEVEKQCLRKEQTTRKITIKGTPDAVKFVYIWCTIIFTFFILRKAVMMIELLMKDHNMLVADIVDRVTSTSTSKSSPSFSSSTDTTNSGVTKNYMLPKEEIQKSPKQLSRIGATLTTAMNNTPVSTKTVKTYVSSNSPFVHTTPTTNIWQKRAEAAIREKKSSKYLNKLFTYFYKIIGPQLNLTIGEKPFIIHSHEDVSSAFHSTNGASNIDFNLTAGKQKVFEASDSVNELSALTKEEHQRKVGKYTIFRYKNFLGSWLCSPTIFITFTQQHVRKSILEI